MRFARHAWRRDVKNAWRRERCSEGLKRKNRKEKKKRKEKKENAKRLKKLLEKKKRTKSASIERKWLNWMKLNGRREKERRRLRKGRRTRIKEDWGIVTWIETQTDLGHQAEVIEIGEMIQEELLH